MDTYDYVLNPYIGCEFGCGYCYAANFSPDQEKRNTWGQWTIGKSNASELIQRMLYHRRNAVPTTLDEKSIYMSTATDPYQPAEKQELITRGVLDTLAGHKTPTNLPPPRPFLVVQTRSPLVIRDVDLLLAIQDNGGRVQVNMTVTTDSDELRKAFEPKCMTNEARLTAITRIHRAGIPTCITLTPLLGVDDPDRFISALLETGAERFITQDFHGSTSGKYTARTRTGAINTRDDIYRSRNASYQKEYRDFVHRLKSALVREKRTFAGEGKPGFKPPW